MTNRLSQETSPTIETLDDLGGCVTNGEGLDSERLGACAYDPRMLF